MEDIGKFLEKFSEPEERNWLLQQLGKKGFNLSGENNSWGDDLLIHSLNELIQRDPKSLNKILNNWRQYRYKNRTKQSGTVTFQVSVSRDVNVELLSLQRQSKLPRNVIFEHLIKDTYQSEMVEQRLQNLRLKEIKLSEQLAKKHKANFDSLKKRFSGVVNGATVAKELSEALEQIEKLTLENENLTEKLNEEANLLIEKDKQIEELNLSLSSEKRINSKLMKEVKEAKE